MKEIARFILKVIGGTILVCIVIIISAQISLIILRVSFFISKLSGLI